MGGKPLNARMTTMTAPSSGSGCWTAATDGGVFSFGGAPFLGSLVTPAAPTNLALGNPAANVPPNPNFLN